MQNHRTLLAVLVLACAACEPEPTPARELCPDIDLRTSGEGEQALGETLEPVVDVRYLDGPDALLDCGPEAGPCGDSVLGCTVAATASQDTPTMVFGVHNVGNGGVELLGLSWVPEPSCSGWVDLVDELNLDQAPLTLFAGDTATFALALSPPEPDATSNAQVCQADIWVDTTRDRYRTIDVRIRRDLDDGM